MICFVVGRILEAEECPLDVQSRWKADEQGTFTLTQAEFEVNIVQLSKILHTAIWLRKRALQVLFP